MILTQLRVLAERPHLTRPRNTTMLNPCSPVVHMQHLAISHELVYRGRGWSTDESHPSPARASYELTSASRLSGSCSCLLEPTEGTLAVPTNAGRKRTPCFMEGHHIVLIGVGTSSWDALSRLPGPTGSERIVLEHWIPPVSRRSV